MVVVWGGPQGSCPPRCERESVTEQVVRSSLNFSFRINNSMSQNRTSCSVWGRRHERRAVPKGDGGGAVLPETGLILGQNHGCGLTAGHWSAARGRALLK